MILYKQNSQSYANNDRIVAPKFNILNIWLRLEIILEEIISEGMKNFKSNNDRSNSHQALKFRKFSKKKLKK